MVNIFMAACMYPVMAIIAYFIYKLSRYEKGKYFGARVKKEWYEDPSNKEVLDGIKSKYKKEFLWITIVLLVTPIAFFFIPFFSIQLMLWMLWMIVMIGIYILPQAKAFKAVRAWKEEKGYDKDYSEEPKAYVELSNEAKTSAIKFKEFIAPTIICLVSAVSPVAAHISGRTFDPANDYLYISFLVSTLLVVVTMYLVAKYISNRSTRVVSSITEVNINYNRACNRLWLGLFRKYAWVSAFLMILPALVYWIEKKTSLIIITGTIVYTIIILIITVLSGKEQSKIDKLYESKFDQKYDLDDDRAWIWGVIYYNPADSRSFVNARLGMGLSCNLAKPVGKIYTAVGIIALLACLVICIDPIVMEFSPMELKIQEESLFAYHRKSLYEIDLDDIKEIQLLDSIPHLSKTVGTATEEMLEGSFYEYDIDKKCEVMLNRKNSKFIMITTKEDKLYYLGADSEEDTVSIYNSIKK